MIKAPVSGDVRTRFVDKYFALWALVIPISSFTMIPSVKGSFPSTIFSIGAAFIICFIANRKDRRILAKIIFIVLFLVIFLTTLSQLSLSVMPGGNVDNLPLINQGDRALVFRSSLFTQLLYLIPCGILFLFVLLYYRRSWDKFILTGIMVLSIYGFYEFIYFLLFHSNGDFISNRMTSGSDEIRSIFASITIGPFTIGRLKSLTGEPSMYAFTVLPYWIYFSGRSRRLSSVILAVSVFLTGSTTAIIGWLIYVPARLRYAVSLRNVLIAVSMIVALSLAVIVYLPDIYNVFVASKLAVDSGSSGERYGTFMQCWIYFIKSSWHTKITGIGFGYVRSADFFSTVLVNNGIIGLVLIIALFVTPVFILGKDRRNFNIKVALIAMLVMMLISVPEVAFQSTWLMLGIAYREVWLERKGRSYNLSCDPILKLGAEI